MKPRRFDPLALAMGLLFALMWSSAFATARIIVADAPPLWALTARFALSGALALMLAALLGQSLRLSRAQWAPVVIFGLCQNGLYLGLNFIAMQRVEASLAAIIASTMPLIVASLAWALRGEAMKPLTLLGLAAGLLGVALIMGSRVEAGGVWPLGLGLCVLAATALAVATLLVQGASGAGQLLPVVGWQMLVGALALGPFAWGFESPFWRPSAPWALAFAYQIFVPGLAATLLWFALVRRVGAVRASAYHFLNPLFGVLIAAALLGEALRPLDAVGVLIVMAGIWAVQRARAPTKM